MGLDAFHRWPELDGLFERALELPPDDRPGFVAACSDDEQLRRELGRLLSVHERAGDFLEGPAAWLPDTVSADGLEPTREALPWAGRAVSHYEIIEPLGSGGMGLVFKAKDVKLDRTVTLKFLQPHLTTNHSAKARFVQEAKAASALDHANICTIYEIGETNDGELFIAMAYYPGETLKERLASGPAPVDEAIAIGYQIAQALARTHQVGIIHRDLKPANIMLTEHGEVKILDFGIAKLEGHADLTETGTRLGTVAYMSPEQARGAAVDHRSDIWAWGVVLYETLTGVRPFHADHEQAVLYSIIHEEPATITALRSDVPDAVRQIVLRALAKNPAERFADMTELLRELRPHYRRSRRSFTLAPLRLPAPPRKLFWGSMAVVVALAAGIGFTVLPRLVMRGASVAAPEVPALVVLPFENLGDPQNDYFAEGVTDEIVHRLATLPGVRVMARTTARQLKDSDMSLAEIGEALDVQYVLEGTVRWAGAAEGTSRVRITPRFVRVRDGVALWSEPFEGEMEDVFRMQAEIAERVATGLQLRLRQIDRRAMRSVPTRNLDAYNVYLLGQYHWNRRTRDELPIAVSYFEQAIDADSSFALAWAGLASGLMFYPFYGVPGMPRHEAFERAERAARTALALDATLAEAHAALGWVLLSGEWDWRGATRSYERAIALAPQYPSAYQWYSQVLRMQGRPEEARSAIARAAELDPLSPPINTSHGWHLLLDGYLAEAVPALERAIELNPDFFWPRLDLGTIHVWRAEWADARRELGLALRLLGMDSARVETVIAAMGRDDAPIAAAAAALDQWGVEAEVTPPVIAWYHWLLGAEDRAVDWLVRAYESRDPNSIDTVVLLRKLRSDPRAAAVLRALDLQ